MPDPEGELTPAQFEILQLLWKAKAGLTVAEIWEATCAQREVGRTTTLNLVDRLEKRGWLRREKVEGVFRYHAAVDQEATKAHMASGFVGNFFGGSPSQFILSLLGTQQVSKAELQRLKSMLDGHAAPPKKRKGE